MRAARQGDFDGLCGLYALINALDLAGCRLGRSPVHRKIFEELAGSLPAATLRRAIKDGLSGRDLLTAAAATFPTFKKSLSGSVSVSRPFRETTFRTNEEFLESIADIMASGRSSLVLNVSTPIYDHWTVAAAITPQAIILRDSGALKELRLDRYTVRRGEYRIRPRETLLVHVRPLKKGSGDSA
jgi:hypothetical protein